MPTLHVSIEDTTINQFFLFLVAILKCTHLLQGKHEPKSTSSDFILKVGLRQHTSGLVHKCLLSHASGKTQACMRATGGTEIPGEVRTLMGLTGPHCNSPSQAHRPLLHFIQ